MPAEWRWYLTISAVRQYMQLAGLSGPLEPDNPDFVRAERELGAYSLTARAANKSTASGAEIYRTGNVTVGGRKMRLEFTVMPAPRREGDKPQLLRVTAK